MTESWRKSLCLVAGGVGTLVAISALDITAGARLGVDVHETLVSLTQRIALWVACAGLAFMALRPTVGKGR